MTRGTQARRPVCFGVFQLDLDAKELRRHRTRIKLQGKPFHVLEALLETPGDVVSREELRRRLWPDDTFVDFDNGLNTAVKRLRIALGDSAANPLYIETLSRSGYRFIVPVEREAIEQAIAPSEPGSVLGWPPELRQTVKTLLTVR